MYQPSPTEWGAAAYRSGFGGQKEVEGVYEEGSESSVGKEPAGDTLWLDIGVILGKGKAT